MCRIRSRRFQRKIEELVGRPYKEVAFEIIGAFFTDYTKEEMKRCVDGAYDSKFEEAEIVPVTHADGADFLELYHARLLRSRIWHFPFCRICSQLL